MSEALLPPATDGARSAALSCVGNGKGLLRLAGFTFGITVQAVFAITVVSLFSFLRYGVQNNDVHWFATDLSLSLFFAVPHSLLLHPRISGILKRWIPSEFYGAFFCLCTCLSLFLIFSTWKTSGQVLWDLNGTAETIVLSAFFGSWISLFYSLYLTGLGYQTGWTPWMFWYRGEKMPRREFYPTGIYLWLRHPVYLSFLGLIWFTPCMTLDHALLTAVWTVYIFAGSILKDERLAFYLGESYRSYQRRVIGYPLITWGRLGKLKTDATAGQSKSSDYAAKIDCIVSGHRA